MRPDCNSDDYAIACCVSPMIVGKQMQFFGARANLAKTLLYAINGGVDEKSKEQVGPKSEPILDEVLDYDTVFARMDKFMDWLATQYVTALNIIHYMHDKYSYEAALMALHDRDVIRTMACGIAGLSVAADSLSAIKYAKVKPIRDENGIAVDFEIEGEYPQFGNNDDRVDDIACDLVERFMKKVEEKFSPFLPDSLVSRHTDLGEALQENFFDLEYQEVYSRSIFAKKETKGLFDTFFEGKYNPTGFVKGWAIENTFTKYIKPLIDNNIIEAGAINGAGDMQVGTSLDSDFSWQIGIENPEDREKIIARYSIKNG